MMQNGELHASPDPSTAPQMQEKRSQLPMHLAIGGMAVGQLADVLTTRAALNRGGTESNGIYGSHPSTAKLVGIKAATMGPLAFLLEKIYKDHPKVAMGIAAGAGGAGLLAAHHNQGVGRK